MANNRYAGISPFTSKQSNIFFGRDNDIEELYEQILLEKQVLLYAKSGIGKSSVVNAGVIPRLNEDGKFTALTIRFRAYNDTDFVSPTQRVINELYNIPGLDLDERSLLELIEADEEKTLWFYFKKIQLINHRLKIVLVFDQFEELFSYPKKQISEFKKQLSEVLKPEVPSHFIDVFSKARQKDRDLMSRTVMGALNKNLPTKAVYIIRSDRLSELNQLRDRIPDIQKSFYELKPLDNEQAKDAIISPAKKEGEFISPAFEYDDDALTEILKYLTNNYEQNIETTQLQIVCQRIEQDIITKDINSKVSKTDIPDFKNIFFDFYNDSIAEIDKENQKNARKLVEDELIRKKQRISLDGQLCLEFLPKEELKKLVDNHLLRSEPNTVGGYSYELSHDTLIEPIHEAAEERRQKEEEAKAQAEREKELQVAKEKAEKDRLEREKERKRQRQIIIIVSIAALVSIAFGIYGYINKLKAEDNIRRLIIKDAYSFKNEEKYMSAKGKYEELLKYVDTTEAIYKRIDECILLDSLSKPFNAEVDILDSLIASSEIDDLIAAKKQFEKIKNIKYEPGNKKLQNKMSTYNLKVSNIIKDLFRKAEMQMGSTGLRTDAIKTIEKIEKISPNNQKVKDFKKRYSIKP